MASHGDVYGAHTIDKLSILEILGGNRDAFLARFLLVTLQCKIVVVISVYRRIALTETVVRFDVIIFCLLFVL